MATLAPSELPRSLFYFAWRKAKDYVLKANVPCDPAEVLIFEQNLEDQLEWIASSFANGEFVPGTIRALPYPKKPPIILDSSEPDDHPESQQGPRCRAAFLVPFRDQVAWSAVLLALGSEFDTNFAPEKGFTSERWMVDWSCAGRLRRHFVPAEKPTQQTDLRRGSISFSTSSLYDSVQYSWRRYREILSQGAQGLSDRKPIYFARTDIKQFYPSLQVELIRAGMLARIKEKGGTQLGSWVPLLNSLLSFEVDYKGLSIDDLAVMGLKGRVQGRLPIGLVAAPFLANIYLTPIDQAINNLLPRRGIAVARYMDDLTFLGHDRSQLQDLVLIYRNRLSRDGIELNESKTFPKGILDQDTRPEWVKLTKRTLHPFVTTTLDHLSEVANMNFAAMTEYERRYITTDLQRMLYTRYAEEEVKEDTKLSFLAWRLRSLALDNHLLDDKNEYRRLRNEIEQCLYRIPSKLGVIQCLVTLLLKTDDFAGLYRVLRRWFFGPQAYWNEEPAGAFVRAYVLHLVAHDAKRTESPKCMEAISRILSLRYTKSFGQQHWYERVHVYWAMARLNLPVRLGVDPLGSITPHVAWSRQVYRAVHSPDAEVKSVPPLALDLFQVGEIRSWGLLVAMAALQIVSEGLDGEERQMRLSRLWANVNISVVKTVPRAIYRLVTLFPETPPPRVVNSLLRLGPLSKMPTGEYTNLFEREAGATWRAAVYSWINHKLEDPTKAQEIERIFQRFEKRSPLSTRRFAKLVHLRMHGEVIQGDRWITLSEWIMDHRESDLNTEQSITRLMYMLVKFVSKHKDYYPQPGMLHPDAVLVRAEAKPGNIHYRDIRPAGQKVIDDRYASPKPGMDQIVSWLAETDEADLCYSLGIILLDLLSGHQLGYNVQVGLQKLRGWYDVAQVLRTARFPSTRLASLISGSIHYHSHVSKGVGYIAADSPERFPLEVEPITELVEWKRITLCHMRELHHGLYVREFPYEVLPIDIDQLRRGGLFLRGHINVVIGQLTSYWEKRTPGTGMQLPSSVWSEIRGRVASVMQVALQEHADIVVLPELLIPNSMERWLQAWAQRLNALVIAGRDYVCRPGTSVLVNEAVVVVPTGVGKRNRSVAIPVPKLHPAPDEEDALSSHGLSIERGHHLYLFRSPDLGNFGVLVCFDFLNLPVQALLQSHVQTLFVVAHNRDLATYESLAESAIRLLHCNVIVCNVADFGGSLAATPYREAVERERLKFRGNHVEGAIKISIPIDALFKHQQDEATNPPHPNKPGQTLFKRLPPDFGTLRLRLSGRPSRTRRD